jgi:hypothetical protein
MVIPPATQVFCLYGHLIPSRNHEGDFASRKRKQALAQVERLCHCLDGLGMSPSDLAPFPEKLLRIAARRSTG